jgi:flagellar biosynthesis chaperone FliJ
MVPSFVASRRRREALAVRVCDAGSGVEAAAEVTVVARHDWSEAAMRLAALERLGDRAREAESAQLLATEQRTCEESSSAQHARRLAASAPEART